MFKPETVIAMKPVVVITAFLMAGCGGGQGHSDSSVRTPLPGGGTLVVHGSLDDSPTMELIEELRIGQSGEASPPGISAEDIPDLFGQLRDFDVDTDGHIYILDYQAQQVRVFAPDGQFVRALAARGRGPGEISGANGVRFDSEGNAWIHDPGNSRVTIMRPTGEILNEMEWRTRSFGYSWRGGGFQGRYWDFTADSDPEEMDQTGVVTSSSTSFLSAFGETQQADTRLLLGTSSGSYIRFRGSSAMSIPFRAHGSIAFDPAGAVWSAERTYRITRFSLSGDTTLVIEASPERARVTPEERAEAIASIQRGMERAGPVEIDWDVIPQRKSPTAEVIPGDEGGVWVRRETPGGEVFDVFDAEGSYIGSAFAGSASSSLVKPVVHGDRIYAVSKGEDGTPVVVRLRLALIRD
jgi:hypothetical protein